MTYFADVNPIFYLISTFFSIFLNTLIVGTLTKNISKTRYRILANIVIGLPLVVILYIVIFIILKTFFD